MFTKENASEYGKRKKGVKHKDTQIKRNIKASLDYADENAMISLVRKNMLKFLNSNDDKTQFEATKYFSEFFTPKKSVQDNRYSGQITFNVNPQLTNKQQEAIEPAEFKVLDSANTEQNQGVDEQNNGKTLVEGAKNSTLLQNNAESKKDANFTEKTHGQGGTPSGGNENAGEVDF